MMWLRHGTGLINLARADYIKLEQTREGWRVVALIAGAHATLATWPTQTEADKHVALLQERLNRIRGK